MTLNFEQLREAVKEIAFAESMGEMRGKAMRLSEDLLRVYAENAKELVSNLAKPAREWDAEAFLNSPDGDYILRGRYSSEWEIAICDEHGRRGEREVYGSLKVFTKDEALAMFAHKDPLERAEIAFGPIPKVPPFNYMSERP